MIAMDQRPLLSIRACANTTLNGGKRPPMNGAINEPRSRYEALGVPGWRALPGTKCSKHLCLGLIKPDPSIWTP